MLTSKIVETSPQVFKRVYTFFEDPIKGYKAEKTEKIYSSTVEYNNWVFDADEKSMDRMARYLNIYSIEMMQDQSNGMSITDSWQKNFIDTTITWKLNNNEKQEMNIQQLFEVYKLCVSNMADNWLK
jgi:hypothetical protein